MIDLDTSYDVIIYTDGGCRGNPGPGAWAYLMLNPSNQQALEGAGGTNPTTNNRMELSAVLMALQVLRRDNMRVLIRSDSKYTIDACSNWMVGWKKRGWQRKGGPLKNVDILKDLDLALSKQQVSFTWVKGHSGDTGNEYVDSLLNKAMDNLAAGRSPDHQRRFVWA